MTSVMNLPRIYFAFKGFLVLVRVVVKILRPHRLPGEARRAFCTKRLNWIDVRLSKKKPPPKAGVSKANLRRVSLFPLCEGLFPHRETIEVGLAL